MSTQRHSKDYGWTVYLIVITVLMVAGYFVISPQKLYKPGDDIGYNMGLVGGLMMIFLLLYPLRKRVSFLNKLGALPAWFKWHMIFGILGPALVVFHSTFHVYIPFIHPTGSVNAAVAMVCMLLVSGSGSFGRFFYTKIHHGLYGRLTTVNELRADMEQSEDVGSVFSFAPNVEKSLEEFRVRAEENVRQSGAGFVNFFTVGFQAAMLSRSLSREVHRLMHEQAKQLNFTDAQLASMEEMIVEYKEKITTYLDAVRDASQFHTYERMFSWWHIFHIPLVYMMVFSAFYNVYAVHAY